MKILYHGGTPDVAEVFVASIRNHPDHLIEFVDACDTSVGDRNVKWVLVISSQIGCPIGCLMCDAGGFFLGNLSVDEMWGQVEYMLTRQHYKPEECQKLKIQFARMGEPSLNDAVLDALLVIGEKLPNAIPCITTMTPQGREEWFEKLLLIKDGFRDFQLQLSLNSTSSFHRDWLMPKAKLSWEYLSDYGRRFYNHGQRKIVLNYALSKSLLVEPQIVRYHFDPKWFVIKLTPINPTSSAEENNVEYTEDEQSIAEQLLEMANCFKHHGFSVIRSIGDLRENRIGSNCGQSVKRLIGSTTAQQASK